MLHGQAGTTYGEGGGVEFSGPPGAAAGKASGAENFYRNGRNASHELMCDGRFEKI